MTPTAKIFDMSYFGVANQISKKMHFSCSKMIILLIEFSNFSFFCYVWQRIMFKMKFNCQPQDNSTCRWKPVTDTSQLKGFVGNRNGNSWIFNFRKVNSKLWTFPTDNIVTFSIVKQHCNNIWCLKTQLTYWHYHIVAFLDGWQHYLCCKMKSIHGFVQSCLLKTATFSSKNKQKSSHRFAKVWTNHKDGSQPSHYFCMT